MKQRNGHLTVVVYFPVFLSSVLEAHRLIEFEAPS